MVELLELAARVIPAMNELEEKCSAAIMSIIPEGHQCGVIHATEEQWNTQSDAFGDRERFYAALMPTEQDAIRMLFAAYERLKKLDWGEITYCPKDGSEFDAIEPGSTGIHKAHYDGEWPKGSWWIASDGDLWPARPILYRLTDAEKARRAALRAKAGDRA